MTLIGLNVFIGCSHIVALGGLLAKQPWEKLLLPPYTTPIAPMCHRPQPPLLYAGFAQMDAVGVHMAEGVIHVCADFVQQRCPIFISRG